MGAEIHMFLLHICDFLVIKNPKLESESKMAVVNGFEDR